MSDVRYFEFRKEIGLGFFNGREPYDQLTEPSQDFLMFNGRDVNWIMDCQARMSDTINDGHLDLAGAWTHRRGASKAHCQTPCRRTCCSSCQLTKRRADDLAEFVHGASNTSNLPRTAEDPARQSGQPCAAGT